MPAAQRSSKGSGGWALEALVRFLPSVFRLRTCDFVGFHEAAEILIAEIGDVTAARWRRSPYNYQQWGLIHLEDAARRGLIQLYEKYGGRLLRMTYPEAVALEPKPRMGFAPSVYVRKADIGAVWAALDYEFKESP